MNSEGGEVVSKEKAKTGSGCLLAVVCGVVGLVVWFVGPPVGRMLACVLALLVDMDGQSKIALAILISAILLRGRRSA